MARLSARIVRTVATFTMAGMLAAGAVSAATAEDIQKPGHGSVSLAGYGIGGKTQTLRVELAGFGLGG